MSIRVQKYGGAALATTDKLNQIAGAIAESAKNGYQLLIVVSAMGSTTDSLLKLASDVAKQPSGREMDMLLSTGERVSAALMSMALIDRGVQSVSFTGSQAGILTTADHSDAEIIDVKPFRVEEHINKSEVVVLAGFQGVCPENKEITTLGRGGTDCTAVAMANYFDTTAEFYKDVGGVYSADPKLISKAGRISRLGIEEAHALSLWGGKIIHEKALRMARKMGRPIDIYDTQTRALGTRIEGENTEDSKPRVAILPQTLLVRGKALEKIDQLLSSHLGVRPRLVYKGDSLAVLTENPSVLQGFCSSLDRSDLELVGPTVTILNPSTMPEPNNNCFLQFQTDAGVHYIMKPTWAPTEAQTWLESLL